MVKQENENLYTMTALEKQTGVNRTELIGIVKGLGIPIRRMGTAIVINHTEAKKVEAVIARTTKQSA